MRPLPRLLLASTAASALLLSACAQDDPVIDLADAPEELTGDDAPADEVEDEPEEPETEPEPEPDAEEPAADDEPAPTPEAALVADPCGPHEGREGEAFIDVASPVDGQHIEDAAAVELVGCSNVPEANVVWELHVDGEVVADGFTTAECGTGCVGAFTEEIDLSAGEGEVELHVLSPDLSDGEGDELRQTVTVTLG